MTPEAMLSTVSTNIISLNLLATPHPRFWLWGLLFLLVPSLCTLFYCCFLGSLWDVTKKNNALVGKGSIGLYRCGKKEKDLDL